MNGEGRTFSPVLIGTARQCSSISFYYYMYGRDVESLLLYLVFDPQPFAYKSQLWNIMGDQGREWKYKQVNVSFPLDFRVNANAF